LQMQKTVGDLYHDASRGSLVLTQRYVNEILNQAKYTSAFVANLPEVKGAMGKWTRYFELDAPAKPGAPATDPTEILVNRLANDLMRAHPDFAYVYLGFEDGGYTQDGEEIIQPDYDPRKRPWYTESKASDTDTTLLSAYITTMGVPNIGVTTKIYDEAGRFIGVSAVDISLGGLTKIIQDIRIGDTGHVMLIQGDGTILSDPRFPDNNFKNIEELKQSAYQSIKATQNGQLRNLDIEGTSYAATVVTSEETGWKLVAFNEEAEIAAASDTAIFNVVLIGVVVTLVFGILGGDGYLSCPRRIRFLTQINKNFQLYLGNINRTLPVTSQ